MKLKKKLNILEFGREDLSAILESQKQKLMSFLSSTLAVTSTQLQ